jgi:aldoxime dehydratase
VESAIPSHLQCPRTRARRVGDDYEPPYPSMVARFEPRVSRVVMGYFGVQYRGDAEPPAATRALQRIAAAFEAAHAPGHWDRARHVDEAGHANVVSIGYWDDPAAFDAWFDGFGARWTTRELAAEGIGTFTEVLRPSVERFETLFSSDLPEGVACVAAGLSGVVQEHAYWGGARDRIPLSQTSELAPAGAPRVEADGERVRVVPHDNLCLIRSGQDWTATEGEERRMYLEDVEPVLRAGMDFLRDQGKAVGCFANRYMTVLDPAGRALEKSFGMSWWKSLAALERWAESHPTHLAIFGAAMKYLGTLGPAARLRLYHEVSVASAAEQRFEYLACHPRTGMLGSA